MKSVLSSSASSLPVTTVPTVPVVPAVPVPAPARVAGAAPERRIAPAIAEPAKISMRKRFDPKLVGALAAVYLIWSSTYLAMRIGVQELPPFGMASLRFAAAGLSLLV